MLEKVSLIIPCQNSETELLQLLRSIPNWNAFPNEIIIIDSSDKRITVPGDFKLFAENISINLLVIYGNSLYPGHARNIGIANSKNSILAFLDSATFPKNAWLSSGLEILDKNYLDGVWGNTYYEASTYFSLLIRACTYGAKPIKTLPGTIVKKHVFNRCGLFIESTRAGEDGDWMSRVAFHKIKFANQEEYLSYKSLNNIRIIDLLKKWFRNYSYSGKLPHRRAQKDIYFYVISLIAVIIAYNWNRVMASWDTESILFIPYVTRIILLLMFFSYILLRGVMLPKKKGVNFSFIFPINFIIISFLSALVDITKALAFGYSKLKKNEF